MWSRGEDGSRFQGTTSVGIRVHPSARLRSWTISCSMAQRPRAAADADNPLDCGLLVVDEVSMVDVMLMRALLAAVPDARRRC